MPTPLRRPGSDPGRPDASPADDLVLLSGEEAFAGTPEGGLASAPIRDLVAALRQGADVLGNLVHVPGVVHCRLLGARRLAVLHQTPPGVRSVRWTTAEQPEDVRVAGVTAYRRVRLSLPYVNTLAVFDLHTMPGRGAVAHLSSWCEVFFANEPLSDLDQEIHGPALLNTTHCEGALPRALALLCTMHVDRGKLAEEPDVNRQVRAGVKAVVGHVYDAGFNFDNELHGMKSWYSATRDARVDARVETVDAWERATELDPGFALTVPWLATGYTYRRYLDVIGKSQERGPAGTPTTAAGFRQLVFREAMRRARLPGE